MDLIQRIQSISDAFGGCSALKALKHGHISRKHMHDVNMRNVIGYSKLVAVNLERVSDRSLLLHIIISFIICFCFKSFSHFLNGLQTIFAAREIQIQMREIKIYNSNKLVTLLCITISIFCLNLT